MQLASAGLPAIDMLSAGHCTQVPSSISPVPVEYLPASHNEHGAEPLTSLYVPATHASQEPPSGPV